MPFTKKGAKKSGLARKRKGTAHSKPTPKGPATQAPQHTPTAKKKDKRRAAQISKYLNK